MGLSEYQRSRSEFRCKVVHVMESEAKGIGQIGADLATGDMTVRNHWMFPLWELYIPVPLAV